MRKTKKLTGLAFTLVALLTFSLTATASMLIPANENAKEHSKAPEHSPVISENWELERVDFVHYAKPETLAKPVKPAPTETCYKLMGYKWLNTPVNYVINPTNPDNLSEEFITDILAKATETWDASTSKELFNDNFTIDSSAQFGVQNFNNAVVFEPYADSGAIAVTSVWFSRKGKQIVEFDMVFNTNYQWGDVMASSGAVMDLQNIATHEFGHSVGLSDIYTDTCSEVTMYGYSTYGDIAKRTLETADTQGIQSIYGE